MSVRVKNYGSMYIEWVQDAHANGYFTRVDTSETS